MTTFNVTPRMVPAIMVGELEVTDPTVFFYGKEDALHDEDERREFIRNYGAQPARPLYDGAPTRVIDDCPSNRYKRQYSQRLTFLNYTNTTLTVIDRLGMPMIVEPDFRRPTQKTEAHVVIRRELFFTGAAEAERTTMALFSSQPLHGRDLQKIHAALKRDGKKSRSNGFVIYMDYEVLETDLEAANGCIYHHKTDVILSTLAPDDTPRHPASSEFVETNSELFALRPLGQDDLSLLLRYVSADPEAKPKYMRFANKVFKLSPEPNHASKLMSVVTRKGGSVQLEEHAEYIEFVYPSRLDTDDPKDTGVRCTRIPLDEAKVLYGIFDNAHDVIEPHDALESVNRRLKDAKDGLEVELKRQKTAHAEELQIAKRTYDETIAEIKREKDIQAERLKTQREIQAHKQKMDFETAKFAINVITIVVGMIPLILKLKSSTSTK